MYYNMLAMLADSWHTHVVCVRRYADGPKYYSDPKLLSFELNPYSSPEATAGEEPLPLGPLSRLEPSTGHLLLINHSLGALGPTAIGAVCSWDTKQPAALNCTLNHD
jgi:hypothetical protein